ncbi:uncharacterized protein LOC124287857 isoform X2 [Haliotis rubra]|uniref:uncharacterized protein LOC124287857 isoform X2 n=1 Tax=Haliotis rubra TaxID=36100 RepID=UPI001EE522FE|nr:uncharacterized protein LOC124287857 isoform X2 [Haliotis rubra]
MKYWTHLLFIVTTCCYVSTQNVTTEGTDTVPTVSISRELRPGSFGLPVPGIVGILTATTTSSPSTTTTGRQCPPGERWNRPRTRSFLECLCERGGPDHQPCILRLSNVLGAFSGRVIPAILPRLTGTDVGFLYLWTFEGFQCNPFMGMGGLSIACYHDIGNSPFSRDCRFSRSRYFCELLMCVDTILADTRSAPQDFLNCVRRIAVPAQNSPVYTWPHTRITHPPIIITHRTTTTDEPAVTSSLRHDDADHADHLEFDQDEHGALGDEHYKYDIIRIVGGVFGGVMTGIFITAVIFILCWFSKRRREHSSSSSPRPRMSVRTQESAIYAEVDDTGSDTGLCNAGYLARHAPDIISVVGNKSAVDDAAYNTLNNINISPGERGYLGRPLSVDSQQYSTITDQDSLSKRSSRSSVYNKLREDGKTTVGEHVYNRAQFPPYEEYQPAAEGV